MKRIGVFTLQAGFKKGRFCDGLTEGRTVAENVSMARKVKEDNAE